MDPLEAQAKIRAALAALKAECVAYCDANDGTNYACDAIGSLADKLSDSEAEFEEEWPQSSLPAEQRHPNNQKAV